MDTSLTIVDSMAPLRNHRHGINQVACHPFDSRIAVADVDMACEIRLADKVLGWVDLRSPEVKARGIQRVRRLFFSRTGNLLFAIAGERLLAIDPDAARVVWSYTPDKIWGFLVSSPWDATNVDQSSVMVVSDNGSIVVLDLAKGAKIRGWRDVESPRFGFALGRRLLGSDSFRLTVWDHLECRKLWHTSLRSRALAMDLSKQDPLAAVRTLEGVDLIDAETGHPLAHIPVGVGLPLLQFHPTQRRLAIAETHGVSIVDFAGRFIHRIEVGTAKVLSLTHNGDGSKLFVGCSDRMVRVFTLG